MSKTNEEKMKLWTFRILLLIILFSIFILADFLIGFYNETSIIRKSMGKFRSEVAPLSIRTNHLIPGIDHKYPVEDMPSHITRSVKTNKYGTITGPLSDTDKPATKILFLGGSTTENNEVDEPYRFPYLVGVQLNKIQTKKFYGINAGVRAHTTQDSLNLYLNHPSPDISNAEFVVVMHNINDRLLLTLSESYKSELNQHSHLSIQGVIDNSLWLLSTFWNWLKYKSNIIYIIDFNLNELTSDTKNDGIEINERTLDKISKLTDKHIQLFRQNIRQLVNIIKTSNKIPILMTQPLGKESNGQNTFNDVIRKVAKKEKIYLIDLAKQIKKTGNQQSLFLSDNIHFNNNGSKWAADTIAKEVNQNLVKPSLPTKSDSLCTPLKIAGKSFLNEPLVKNIFPGRYPNIDKTGARLLFQTNDSNGSSISVLDLKTGNVNQLLHSKNTNWYEHPTWYDKNTIIYGVKKNSENYLYILDIEKKTSRKLFDDKNMMGAIANVSPDKKIFFAGYTKRNNKLTNPEIYFMEDLHSNPKQLTKSQSENWRPFYSKKENSVYYINNKKGNFHIYKINLSDTHESVQITKSNMEHWDPTISKDGSLMAYAVKDNGNFDIWIDKTDKGTHFKRKVIYSAENEWDPRFSPDSQYLFFAGTSPHGDQIRAICLKDII